MSELEVTTGSYQPLEGELLALPQAATESAVQKDSQSLEPIVGELCALLGPHVSSLVRDPNGALDLSRIPAKGFFEFRQFLIDQTAVGDGVIFGSPFSDLIAKNEYQDLWQLLYDRVNHRVLPDFLPKYEADQLLYKFKAELIAIDAEAFVRQNFSSQQGRAKLADLLADNSYRYMEVRPDLVRALARVGKDSVDAYEADRITEHVNFSDYFNHWVTDEELAGATKAALALLRSADRVYADVEQRQSDSVEEPGKIVSSLVGAEAVSYFAHQAQFEFAKSDPVSQLKGRLARLWLWAADDNNWGRLPGDYEREDVDFARASVLQNVEDAIGKAPYIQSQSDLEIFNERLQDFLRGPINHHSLGPIDLSLWDKAADIAVGRGLDSLVSGLQAPLRAPFDDLLQLSDEIKFSLAMGEKILHSPLPSSSTNAATQFIDGLEDAKRSLWYGYKQHKFISRVGSNVADLFGTGDIADIRKANAQIDLWVSQISRDTTDRTINDVIEEVFGSLSEGGALYEALVASEMEGIEQTLGLLQTTLIIIATSIATSGIATAAGVAVRTAAGIAERIAMTEREIRAAQAAIIAAKTATTVARTTAAAAETADRANNTNRRMLKAFGYGAYIATAENAIAVTTGEVRGQPDTLASWGKDALATGVAMSMTGALPVSHGGHNNVIGNLMARYTVGGARGLSYLGMDAGVETAEEGIDQYLRQILDGNTAALSAKQWRELALLSASGGFTKVGAVAEAIRGGGRPVKTGGEDDEPTLVRKDRKGQDLPFPRSDRGGSTEGGYGIEEDQEILEDAEAPPDEGDAPFDTTHSHQSRSDCIRALVAWQEQYYSGRGREFERAISKWDNASLKQAFALMEKLATDKGRRALLKLMGDDGLPLSFEERKFAVDMMARHESEFDDPDDYLDWFVLVARRTKRTHGENGLLFELDVLKALENHPFIHVAGVSVHFEHEVDLCLQVGGRTFLVELKTALSNQDTSKLLEQFAWFASYSKANDHGALVVVKNKPRPGGTGPAGSTVAEWLKGERIPVFGLDEFLALPPGQFEELHGQFLKAPANVDPSDGGSLGDEDNEAEIGDFDKASVDEGESAPSTASPPQTGQVTLRDRIERAIKASGINHQKFAKMVGVSGSYISSIKSGAKVPPEELRQKIEGVLLSLENQPQETKTARTEPAQAVDGAPRDGGLSAYDEFRRSKAVGTGLGMVVAETAAVYEAEARRRAKMPKDIEEMKEGLDAIFNAALAIHKAGNEHRAEQFSEILLTLVHSGQINWKIRKGFRDDVARKEVFADPARLGDYHLVVLSLGDPRMSPIAWNGYLEDLRGKKLTNDIRTNLRGHKQASFDENPNHPVHVFKRDHGISRWLARKNGNGSGAGIGQVADKAGEVDKSKDLTPALRKSLERSGLDLKDPDAAQAVSLAYEKAAGAGLSRVQTASLFRAIVRKTTTSRNALTAFKALPTALEAARAAKLAPDKIFRILSLLVENTREGAFYAFEALPAALKAACAAGLTSDKTADFFEEVIKITGMDSAGALEALPDALGAGLSPEQIIFLFELIVRETGPIVGHTFSAVRPALRAAHSVGLNADQIVKILEQIVKTKKGKTPDALEDFVSALRTVRSADLSPDQIADVLTGPPDLTPAGEAALALHKFRLYSQNDPEAAQKIGNLEVQLRREGAEAKRQKLPTVGGKIGEGEPGSMNGQWFPLLEFYGGRECSEILDFDRTIQPKNKLLLLPVASSPFEASFLIDELVQLGVLKNGEVYRHQITLSGKLVEDSKLIALALHSYPEIKPPFPEVVNDAAGFHTISPITEGGGVFDDIHGAGVTDRFDIPLVRIVSVANPQILAWKALTENGSEDDSPVVKWAREWVDEAQARLFPVVSSTEAGDSAARLVNGALASRADYRPEVAEGLGKIFDQWGTTHRQTLNIAVLLTWAMQGEPGSDRARIYAEFAGGMRAIYARYGIGAVLDQDWIGEKWGEIYPSLKQVDEVEAEQISFSQDIRALVDKTTGQLDRLYGRPEDGGG